MRNLAYNTKKLEELKDNKEITILEYKLINNCLDSLEAMLQELYRLNENIKRNERLLEATEYTIALNEYRAIVKLLYYIENKEAKREYEKLAKEIREKTLG